LKGEGLNKLKLLESVNTKLKRINIWKVSTLILAISLVLTISVLMSVRNAQNLTYIPAQNGNNQTGTIDVPSIVGPVLPQPPAVQSDQENPPDSHHQSVSYSEGIKVYGADFPNELKSIDWGTIFVGIHKNYSISVLNYANQPVSLSLQVTNWNPGVDASITWNYDGKTVPVNTIIPVTLTLLVRSANTTSFSNSIHITATDA
jgi:hypothetical protein